MVGWHHRLNGLEFEQALGDTGGQGSLACCSPWGCKASDTTEQPNKNKVKNGNLYESVQIKRNRARVPPRHPLSLLSLPGISREELLHKACTFYSSSHT